MPVTTKLNNAVPESSSAVLSGTLKDDLGVVIPSADITTMTFTLYLAGSPATIINFRYDIDINNVNGGTIHASSGAWSLSLTQLDNAAVGTTGQIERHIALIEWTYNLGAKTGRAEISYPVQPMDNVP